MIALIPTEHAKASGIYIIRNSVNAKVYVGSAVNLKRRFNDHLRLLKKGTHHSSLLQRFCNKYGIHTLTFELLTACPPKLLIATEQQFIDNYRSAIRGSGFNISPTAGSQLGTTHTVESRAKISAAKKGVSLPKSAEHIAKIADIVRARVLSPEALAKMSAGAKARKFSSEALAKIATASTGRPKTAENRAKQSASLKVTLAARRGEQV